MSKKHFSIFVSIFLTACSAQQPLVTVTSPPTAIASTPTVNAGESGRAAISTATAVPTIEASDLTLPVGNVTPNLSIDTLKSSMLAKQNEIQWGVFRFVNNGKDLYEAYDDSGNKVPNLIFYLGKDNQQGYVKATINSQPLVFLIDSMSLNKENGLELGGWKLCHDEGKFEWGVIAKAGPLNMEEYEKLPTFVISDGPNRAEQEKAIFSYADSLITVDQDNNGIFDTVDLFPSTIDTFLGPVSVAPVSWKHKNLSLYNSDIDLFIPIPADNGPRANQTYDENPAVYPARVGKDGFVRVVFQEGTKSTELLGIPFVFLDTNRTTSVSIAIVDPNDLNRLVEGWSPSEKSQLYPVFMGEMVTKDNYYWEQYIVSESVADFIFSSPSNADRRSVIRNYGNVFAGKAFHGAFLSLYDSKVKIK